jgi:hypothetical protein
MPEYRCPFCGRRHGAIGANGVKRLETRICARCLAGPLLDDAAGALRRIDPGRTDMPDMPPAPKIIA